MNSVNVTFRFSRRLVTSLSSKSGGQLSPSSRSLVVFCNNNSNKWQDNANLCRQLHTGKFLHDSFKIQDEADFYQKVLKSKKPVVVQFHATWCGPCKQLAPRMEKAIAALKDAVDLAQVDIDDNPDIAMQYSVGAVPAVMAVKDGKVVDKFVGLKDEDQVDNFVAKLVK